MTKILRNDEMLDILKEIEHPLFGPAKQIMESIGTAMAEAIAGKLGVDYDPAVYEGSAFAGTCSCFYATHEGQECPSPLDQYDETEWGIRGEDFMTKGDVQ